MRSARWIIALAMCIAFVGAASIAVAQPTTYEFISTASPGEWDTPGNWDPPGPPGPTGKAVIPNGKWCTIAADHQEAAVIDVQSGGKLTIDGKDLTLPSFTFPYYQYINGTLELKNSGRILYTDDGSADTLILGGSGTIDATDANGLGPGSIETAAGEAADVLIGADLTVKGSVSIDIAGNLEIAGTLYVDDADDHMQFGPLSSGTVRAIYGGGTITTAAGSINVGRMQCVDSSHFNLHWTGSINVGSNGTLTVSQYGFSHHLQRMITIASGGELNCDSSVNLRGCLAAGDAIISVASGCIATFQDD